MQTRNLLRFAALLGTLITVHTAMAQSPALFITAPSYAVGANPVSVAVADFNGDGHADLVLANHTPQGSVSVLLGSGDGTFQAAQSYATGPNPVSVAVGDFNGDGRSDLVVVSYADPGTVNILLGNGDGTFQAAQSYAAGSAPVFVAVGDFNGDGHLDLAVTNETVQGAVSILLGNGDGTFQAPQSYAVGSYPNSVATGDFNHDGVLDLAVTNGSFTAGAVSILVGNGDGTFQGPQNYATGSYPVSVAVGDFNGDGAPDLAVADFGDNNVNILLGNGDGTFQAAVPYAVGTPNVPGSQNLSLAVGDFNGDGHLDLAVITLDSATVVLLLGKGDGTFQAAPANSTVPGSNLSALAVGDFNGDGHLDLAVANNTMDGTVSILLGNGDATFRAAQSYAAGPSPSSVAAGDFNGDRHLDLVVTNSSANTVSVLLGNGDGTFRAAQTYAAGPSPSSVAVGDFNGDGHLDLAVANGLYGLPSTVSVLLGNGDGTFQAAQSYAAGTDPRSVVAGDFNGDGIPDLAVADAGTPPSFADRGVTVLLGKGDGTFQAVQTYPALGLAVAVADVNGDRKPDLVTSGGSVLLGNGDGSFQAAPSIAAGNGPSFGGPNSIAVGDFNGDGKVDIAIGVFAYAINGQPPPFQITESDVRVFLGNGDGTFQAAATFAAGSGPNALAVGDFNGDGVSDLAVADSANPLFLNTTVSVLLGKGDGSFLAPQGFGVDTSPVSMVVGDFNGDGFLDLAVIEQTDRVTILLNAANRGG